jgi:hypothetical protein
MRFTKSWFLCNPPPRTAAQRCHPAKFPEGLAREFIEFFTRPGEAVLDPFSGVGSTVSAAAAAGRRGVGIELSADFVALARAAAAKVPVAPGGEQTYLHGDAGDAARLCRAAGVPVAHYVLTSPPYWDMLLQGRGNVVSTHQQRRRQGLPTAYTDDPADLGRIADYDEFLATLARIFGDLKGLLAPGRYLTVIVQNVRVPAGHVRPLAWDLARALSASFAFKGERLWLQDNKRLGCWGWPSEFVTNVHHHYCLVFKNE